MKYEHYPFKITNAILLFILVLSLILLTNFSISLSIQDTDYSVRERGDRYKDEENQKVQKYRVNHP